jgi:hypothetical protein
MAMDRMDHMARMDRSLPVDTILTSNIARFALPMPVRLVRRLLVR